MNDYILKNQKNELIKCKERVQMHGEVFTPKHMVNLMLEQDGIKECCNNITTTFLEPAAGEGAFLTEILDKKLFMVKNKYNSSIVEYEHYSLLALTTIYGVELLADNTELCVMNLYEVYMKHYNTQLVHHSAKFNENVLKSAKTIISKNIVQGNFLTKTSIDNSSIIFNEWKPISLKKDQKRIKIIRTEYSLDEILTKVNKEDGSLFSHSKATQLNLFTWNNEFEEDDIELKYIPTFIDYVYKERMKEIHDR